MPGHEIKKLRDQGIKITYNLHNKLFVFLGDTTEKVFVDYPQITAYPCIIVECTFIDPNHLETSRDKKHVHWLNIKSIIKDHSQTQFILIHFSMQYKMEYVLSFFDTELKNENIQNVHFGKMLM